MNDDDTLVVQEFRKIPRIVYTSSVSNRDTPWSYNISNRYFKVSPPGLCPVINYKIDKVMSEQGVVDEPLQNLLFSVSSSGTFSIKKFDLPILLYKVYISPCNQQMCGQLGNDANNFTAVVTINSIPNSPIPLPQFSAPLVSPVI